MQNKKNKKIISILILFVLTYILINSILINISYATTYTYTKDSNDLPKDFDLKYPGYRTLINTVVTEHPNWTINLVETGLDWNTVLDNESKHGKNLVQPGYYTQDYGCSCGVAYDGPWKCASRQAVEYMMDPRNFINSYDIFQFQDLTSSIGDENAVKAMIKNSFMDKDSFRDDCIKGIMEAAKTYGISPYFIVSKILQEQGVNGSALSLGEGYDINGDGQKEFEGYYNLFNIGAYDADGKGAIENGLSNAQSKGWDSMYKSIVSGASFIKNSYMAVGQTTVYFQKYNVINKKNLYYNQYMTNVWGAYSEGKIMRNKYINYGIYENSFTFLIPLYENMPSTTGDLARINVNEGYNLALRNGAGSSASTILRIDRNVIVRVTERANSMVDGQYWDKVKTPYGTGYMARNAIDNSKNYLDDLPLIIPNTIDINVNNGISNPDENNNIFVEPNTTVGKLKESYPEAIVKDKNGNEITGDTLIGTGAKVFINNEEKYTVVKLGDANGDGEVDIIDMALVKRHLVGTNKLEGEYEKAVLLQENAEIDIIDMALIKRHLVGTQKITL